MPVARITLKEKKKEFLNQEGLSFFFNYIKVQKKKQRS